MLIEYQRETIERDYGVFSVSEKPLPKLIWDGAVTKTRRVWDLDEVLFANIKELQAQENQEGEYLIVELFFGGVGCEGAEETLSFNMPIDDLHDFMDEIRY